MKNFIKCQQKPSHQWYKAINSKFKENYTKFPVAIVAMLLPAVGFAAGNSAILGVLQFFPDLLTITSGKLIATFVIVGVGLGCFVFRKSSNMWIMAVVVGVGIVFGANSILKGCGMEA